MKKSIQLVCILMSCLIFLSTAHAETKPLEKMERGVINIITSPIELPKQVRSYWIQGSELTPHILVWIFCGVVKGGVNMIERIGSGVWDIVAAGVDVPQGGGSLMQPAKVFDEWPKRTRPAKPML